MKLGGVAPFAVVVGSLVFSFPLGCSKSRDSTAVANGSSSVTSGSVAGSAAIRVTVCAYGGGAERETMAAMVGPLTRGLVQRLAQPAEVTLKVLATQDQAVEALASGGVDLCPLDPARYLTARQKRRDVTVLVAEADGGRKVVDGAVVVKKGSRLQKLADAQGHRFAFGDPEGMLGRYAVQHALLSVGLHAKDLSAMKYLGGSELVAAAVRRGEFDMGIVKTSAVAAELADGSLRVVQRVSALTRPWAVSGGLEAAVMDSLRAVLVGFDDNAALSSLGISGFIGVNEDHDAARAVVEAGEEFIGKPSSAGTGVLKAPR